MRPATIPPLAIAQEARDADEIHRLAALVTPDPPRAEYLDVRALQEEQARALNGANAFAEVKAFRLYDDAFEGTFGERCRVARSRMGDVVSAMRRAEKFGTEQARNAVGLTAMDARKALDGVIEAIRDGVR